MYLNASFQAVHLLLVHFRKRTVNVIDRRIHRRSQSIGRILGRLLRSLLALRCSHGTLIERLAQSGICLRRRRRGTLRRWLYLRRHNLDLALVRTSTAGLLKRGQWLTPCGVPHPRTYAPCLVHALAQARFVVCLRLRTASARCSCGITRRTRHQLPLFVFRRLSQELHVIVCAFFLQDQGPEPVAAMSDGS